jgi:hypothetical protein
MRQGEEKKVPEKETVSGIKDGFRFREKTRKTASGRRGDFLLLLFVFDLKPGTWDLKRSSQCCFPPGPGFEGLVFVLYPVLEVEVIAAGFLLHVLVVLPCPRRAVGAAGGRQRDTEDGIAAAAVVGA